MSTKWSVGPHLKKTFKLSTNSLGLPDLLTHTTIDGCQLSTLLLFLLEFSIICLGLIASLIGGADWNGE